MPYSHLLALRPEASSGYRRAWAREWPRERFWVLPALLAAAARQGISGDAARPGPLGLG